MANEARMTTDRMDDWVVGKDGSSAQVAATGKNLPWQWKEDGLTVTRSAAWSAPGCHLGCGVKVYTDENGNFVKLEGDEANPFNQGRLCIRCLSFDQSSNTLTDWFLP